MFRVAVKLALAAAALWAVWTFVPVHGRTLAQRWRDAGDLSTFVERAVAEVTGGAAAKPPAKGAKAQARQKPAASRPTEGHTDSDRRAVDRILADRL